MDFRRWRHACLLACLPAFFLSFPESWQSGIGSKQARILPRQEATALTCCNRERKNIRCKYTFVHVISLVSLLPSTNQNDPWVRYFIVYIWDFWIRKRISWSSLLFLHTQPINNYNNHFIFLDRNHNQSDPLYVTAVCQNVSRLRIHC